MHSRRNKHTFFRHRPLRLGIFVLTCDGYIFAAIASQGSAQYLTIKEVAGKGQFFDCVEVITKVGVSVGERMSEVHLVIVTRKRVSECETVVALYIPELAVVSFEVVLIVTDVGASAVPAYVLILPVVNAEAQHSHTEIVKTVWFCEIQNIESDLHIFASVPDFEEVPLRVTVSVDIVLQNKVVLIFAHLHGAE